MQDQPQNYNSQYELTGTKSDNNISLLLVLLDRATQEIPKSISSISTLILEIIGQLKIISDATSKINDIPKNVKTVMDEGLKLLIIDHNNSTKESINNLRSDIKENFLDKFDEMEKTNSNTITNLTQTFDKTNISQNQAFDKAIIKMLDELNKDINSLKETLIKSIDSLTEAHKETTSLINNSQKITNVLATIGIIVLGILTTAVAFIFK